MDQGKLATGLVQNRDKTEADYVYFEVPLVDALGSLRTRLVDYQLVANPNGSFCGYDVYYKCSKIEGLTLPDGFYYWRKVDPKNRLEVKPFEKAVRKAAQGAIASLDPDDSSEKRSIAAIVQVSTELLQKRSSTKTDLYLYALQEVGHKTPIVTLSGRSGYHKIVPQESWFPHRLTKYDARDLLRLLPDAEADQLMLILGRVMVGASGSETAEGPLQHYFRSMGFLVGLEPGLGKSTLMNWICEALKTLGYSVSTINGNLGKFGWGSVATSDLAYIDDLVEENQKALYGNPNLKSLVSNGTLVAERKGIDGVEVNSSTVVIGCTNHTSYKDYLKLDQGVISRLNQLYTYNSIELASRWGGDPRQHRTADNWLNVCREYQVDLKTLTMYLLMRCAERFLEATGYELGDSGLVQNPEKNTLEHRMKVNRSSFRIDTGLRHADEFVEKLANFFAAALDLVAEDDLPKIIKNTDINPTMVLHFLLFQTEKESRDVPEFFLEELTPACYPFLCGKKGDYQTAHTTSNLDKVFNSLMSELKSTKGIGYPLTIAHYQAYWLNFKHTIYERKEEMTPIGRKLKGPGRQYLLSLSAFLSSLA